MAAPHDQRFEVGASELPYLQVNLHHALDDHTEAPEPVLIWAMHIAEVIGLMSDTRPESRPRAAVARLKRLCAEALAWEDPEASGLERLGTRGFLWGTAPGTSQLIILLMSAVGAEFTLSVGDEPVTRAILAAWYADEGRSEVARRLCQIYNPLAPPPPPGEERAALPSIILKTPFGTTRGTARMSSMLADLFDPTTAAVAQDWEWSDVADALHRARTTSQAPASPPLHPAGWHPDPEHRADYRYWDGDSWTNWVSTAGRAHEES